MATLAELSRVTGGELNAPSDLEITGVGSIENAGPNDIAPVSHERYVHMTEESNAGAFLVATRFAADFKRPCIACEHTLVALNAVMKALGLVRQAPIPGIHPTALIDETAKLGHDVHIGPYVVVEAGARIGARSVLRARVLIEAGVEIGEDCVIDPGAVLHIGTVLKNRVHVGANTVTGREGFAFAMGPNGLVRLHHVGSVVLEDDVQLGVGCAIDRARFDVTRVGRRCGVDNFVHIGHNCTIDDDTFLAAQVGLAGMTRIGKNCEIGGQVGICNGAVVGDGARVGAQAGVIKSQPAGSELWGTPARDKFEHLREAAFLRRLVKGDKA